MADDKQQGKLPDYWGTSAAKFYADVEGETITVHLLGGAVMTGELVGVDKYNLFLQRDGKTVLVAKHAVEWVELANIAPTGAG